MNWLDDVLVVVLYNDSGLRRESGEPGWCDDSGLEIRPGRSEFKSSLKHKVS